MVFVTLVVVLWIAALPAVILALVIAATVRPRPVSRVLGAQARATGLPKRPRSSRAGSSSSQRQGRVGCGGTPGWRSRQPLAWRLPSRGLPTFVHSHATTSSSGCRRNAAPRCDRRHCRVASGRVGSDDGPRHRNRTRAPGCSHRTWFATVRRWIRGRAELAHHVYRDLWRTLALDVLVLWVALLPTVAVRFAATLSAASALVSGRPTAHRPSRAASGRS